MLQHFEQRRFGISPVVTLKAAQCFDRCSAVEAFDPFYGACASVFTNFCWPKMTTFVNAYEINTGILRIAREAYFPYNQIWGCLPQANGC